MKKDYKNYFVMKKCPICGKEFHPAPQHAWTIGTESSSKIVCSYTCMRAWEKKNLPHKRRSIK